MMRTARTVTGALITILVGILFISAAEGAAAGAWWPITRGATGLLFLLVILRLLPVRH